MTAPRIAFVLLATLGLATVPFLGAVQPAHAHVTASEVRDRPSLRAFVERAADLTEQQVNRAADGYAFFDRTFRPTGEWRMGSIYIYVLTGNGTIRFHGASKAREGQNLYNHKDKTGKYYVRELLTAAKSGGGFVEYYFDDPAVSGDEEEGSLKIGYIMPVHVGAETLYIGSGVYPGASVPVAPPLALLALATLLAGGGYRRLRKSHP